MILQFPMTWDAGGFPQEPVHEQHENEDGEVSWEMKWKKEFTFALAGDMRELRWEPN